MALLLIYYNVNQDKFVYKFNKAYYSRRYYVGQKNSYGHLLVNMFVITDKGLFRTDDFNLFKKEYLENKYDNRSLKDKTIDYLVDKLKSFKG